MNRVETSCSCLMPQLMLKGSALTNIDVSKEIDNMILNCYFFCCLIYERIFDKKNTNLGLICKFRLDTIFD